MAIIDGRWITPEKVDAYLANRPAPVTAAAVPPKAERKAAEAAAEVKTSIDNILDAMAAAEADDDTTTEAELGGES